MGVWGDSRPPLNRKAPCLLQSIFKRDRQSRVPSVSHGRKNPPTFLMEKESRGNTEQQTIEPSASVSQRAVEGCFPALPVILSLMS